VTISDSRAGQGSVSHTFAFTTATTGTIKTVVFEYKTTATGATVPTGLITTTATQGSLTGLGASTSDVAANGTITLTVTSAIEVAATTAIVVPYTAITNPTTNNTTSFVQVTTKDAAGDVIDSAVVAFAVLTPTSVSMTASVDPTFSFAVAGVGTTSPVNSAETNIVTTSTTIPFGTLTSGNPKIGAIDATISTNALVGYTVTIAALTDPPLSTGSANIDYYAAGTNATPIAWDAPTGVANTNSGFIGYTTEENEFAANATRFTATGGNKWAGLRNAPEEVAFSATGKVPRTTRIGLQIEINAVQPAGSYAGTVLLVATPTY
jgi:hypothetical protein